MGNETDVLWQRWNLNQPTSDGFELSEVEVKAEILECGKGLKMLLWATCV